MSRHFGSPSNLPDGLIQHSVSTDQLRSWYEIEKKSTRQVADLLGVSQPWARKLMAQRGISCRARAGLATRPKGFKMSEEQKANIAKALTGKKRGRSPKYQREFVECSWCHTPVERKRCARQKHKSFCSATCIGKANGERFRREKFKREANGTSNWVTIPCLQCGSEITRLKIIAERQRNFCSRACSNRWRSLNLTGDKLYNYKGGYLPYYGPNWREQRRRARVRDNYTCQRCGITKEEKGKNPDVHHIIRFREFGIERYKEANALSNLICYCNVCHKIVEEEQL